MRVLFWGTPEFAVPSLRALVGEGFDVCGVVTQPDRPAGRSRAVAPPPAKRVALEEQLPIFQPATPRDPEFRDALEDLRPDISIVVAYGHILQQPVIDAPALGTLNVHASLLPALRGAAPIQGALRLGLPETGVSIMRMVRALDAGPVLLRAPIPVAGDETYGELRVRLAELGALALVEALALLQLGRSHEEPQDDALATYAPKVTRETTRVDWALGVRDVVNTIRAYDPTPGAWTSLGGVDVKLFGARGRFGAGDAAAGGRAADLAPAGGGEVLGLEGDALLVACGDGIVSVAEVQPAGRVRMSGVAWHRGRGVVVGDRLG